MLILTCSALSSPLHVLQPVKTELTSVLPDKNSHRRKGRRKGKPEEVKCVNSKNDEKNSKVTMNININKEDFQVHFYILMSFPSGIRKARRFHDVLIL